MHPLRTTSSSLSASGVDIGPPSADFPPSRQSSGGGVLLLVAFEPMKPAALLFEGGRGVGEIARQAAPVAVGGVKKSVQYIPLWRVFSSLYCGIWVGLLPSHSCSTCDEVGRCFWPV